MKDYTQYKFDEDQHLEIQIGLYKGLDITSYAKPELMAIQMRQIRLGLEEGLDASVYSLPEYDWFQMEEIRLGMHEGLSYELYANPAIDYKRMRQIRKGLKAGIDLSPFVKFDAGILKELRKAIVARVSIVEYIKEGYQEEQLAQIRIALEKKLDIRPHITVEHLGASIREIALGLERALPVSVYESVEYSWQQMKEIRLGMEARVDVSVFSNSLYGWQQMRELRLGLEEGLDVSCYKSFVFTPTDMEKRRKKLLAIQNGEMDAEPVISTEIEAQEVSDEELVVFVSSDEMEACIEIRCDKEAVVTEADIYTKLSSYGVTKGILDEEVKKIVLQRRYRETIVIAQGVPSQKGKDGYYEFYFNTNPSKTPKIHPDGTADFRDIDWFEIVEKGQKIACYFPADSGTDGYTVTGKTIRALKGKEKNMLSGKGFELMEDGRTYLASLDGKIDLIGDIRIEITRVCVVDEVNLSTGNINFDGSVYVKGNVSANATICATENIVVNGYVEASTIRCGGEVCLRKGINGGGIGVVEAKGGVLGQFFEGVRVVSGGDISAHYAMNCEMYAAGYVQVYGAKGSILGGYTRAARGIKAYNIGNQVGLLTQLNVGLDTKSMNRMLQLDATIENVKKELSILTNSCEDFKKKYPAEVRNAMDIFLKIENAIYTKELQLKGLLENKEVMDGEMEEMKDARVVVSGILYEGTQVTVDNIVWDAFSVKDVTIRCVKKKILVESN